MKQWRSFFSGIFILACSVSFLQAQQSPQAFDTEMFEDNARHWYGIFDKHNVINPSPDRPRYKATQLQEIGDNILLFQQTNGGWPKNYDITAILSKEQKDTLLKNKSTIHTTFDNGTTFTHVSALANIYAQTKLLRFKDAAVKGLDFILKAQYKNGGWPQYYPLENNYSKHITYNDGVITGIMRVLKDVADNKPLYAFVAPAKRKEITAAYNNGISCILKTQIREKGKLLAWCQQHDEVTLKPVWARAFEPAAICNQESADLVLFLMSVEKPSPEIRQAITAAVQWFTESKILETRVVTVKAADTLTAFRESKTDKVVVKDPAAPPIWTRFYELETHRPLFCNRDSKVVYSLAEVERERRDGYAWYTYAPKKAIDRFEAWKKKTLQ
jgi:PelA/Pel-15E family pectate lyase